MLDPQSISLIYSEAEILTEINSLKAIIEEVKKIKSYSLDDMQSKQKVDNQDLSQMAKLLNSYMKALIIKRGISATEIISLSYTGDHE